jgi:hypothetical protein
MANFKAMIFSTSSRIHLSRLSPQGSRRLVTIPMRWMETFAIRGISNPEKLTLTVSEKGTGSGEIKGTMVFNRKDYGMNSGIPFIKIADHVDVSSTCCLLYAHTPRCLSIFTEIRPRFRANNTTSALLFRLKTSMMWCLWNSTVFLLKSKSPAISFIGRPSASI